jgi:hypothetical protein
MDHECSCASSGKRIIGVWADGDAGLSDLIVNLVVPYQPELVSHMKSSHSVMRARRGSAIRHDRSRLANNRVLKASWQSEYRFASVVGFGW